MPEREAVLIGEGEVVEVRVLLNHVQDREPGLVPVRVVEPGAGLPVKVHCQVKDHFSKLQSQFELFRSIEIGDNLSKT